MSTDKDIPTSPLTKTDDLKQKLKDETFRSKLGINQEDLDSREEIKQNKYLFSINAADRKSEHYSGPKSKSNRKERDDVPHSQDINAASVNSDEQDLDYLDSDDSDGDESVLSEISDENMYFQKKLIY